MEKKPFKFLALILVLLSISCTKNNDCTESPKEDCFCTLQYDPVCGCNQKTYGNACIAACAGIGEVTPGECADIYVGVWNLIEYNLSPGTPSNFVELKSNLMLTIKQNGEVESNGQLCNISLDAGEQSVGTLNFSNQLLSINNCSQEISVEKKDGFLFLTYPCDEPCITKFKKID